MLDFSNFSQMQGADIQIFNAGSSTWNKPRGKSMAYIICIGGGGGGGNGSIAANGTAAGGGGGGSGAQGTLLIPIASLPDQLGIYVGLGGTPTSANLASPGGATVVYFPNPLFGVYNASGSTTTLTVASMINGIAAVGQTLYHSAAFSNIITLGTGTGGTGTYTTNLSVTFNATPIVGCPANCVLLASQGGTSGAYAGSGGAGGGVNTLMTIASSPLAGLGLYNFIAGDSGTAGGLTNAAGTTKTVGVTGLYATGGTGGGAMGTAAGSAGLAGGALTMVANGFITSVPASPGGAAGTNFGANGSNGVSGINKLMYSIGGTGGGGAGTNATPTTGSIG
jgi:hypothetical protein